MNRIAQSIKNRLSLRPPQADSLNILAELTDKLTLKKHTPCGNKMGISQEGNEPTPHPSKEGNAKSPLSGGDSGVGSHVKNLISQIAQRQQAEILQMNSERNAGFFDTEMEKLDRWAEDVKSSMEIELNKLDRNNRTVYYQGESYIIVS